MCPRCGSMNVSQFPHSLLSNKAKILQYYLPYLHINQSAERVFRSFHAWCITHSWESRQLNVFWLKRAHAHAKNSFQSLLDPLDQYPHTWVIWSVCPMWLLGISLRNSTSNFFWSHVSRVKVKCTKICTRWMFVECIGFHIFANSTSLLISAIGIFRLNFADVFFVRWYVVVAGWLAGWVVGLLWFSCMYEVDSSK